MDAAVGAKSTKPGSKATARRGTLAANGKPPRVPVGDLHIIDLAAQPTGGAGFTAVCGETSLVSVDGTWDDDFPNERCEMCADRQWQESFNAMQSNMLK